MGIKPNHQIYSHFFSGDFILMFAGMEPKRRGRPKLDHVEPKARLHIEISLKTKERLRALCKLNHGASERSIVEGLIEEAERRGFKPGKE